MFAALTTKTQDMRSAKALRARISMAATLVTSTEHPLVKKIRLVASRARRAPAELVLAEGIRVLEEATNSNHPFEAVLLSDGFGTDERETALVQTWHSREIMIRRAAGPLFRSLSGVLSPQGALALVRVPNLTLNDVPTRIQSSDPVRLRNSRSGQPGHAAPDRRGGRRFSGLHHSRDRISKESESHPLQRRSLLSHSRGRARGSLRIPRILLRPQNSSACALSPVRERPSGRRVFGGPRRFCWGVRPGASREKEWSDIPAIHIPMVAWIRVLECGGRRSDHSL